jgi:hypothetical protein
MAHVGIIPIPRLHKNDDAIYMMHVAEIHRDTATALMRLQKRKSQLGSKEKKSPRSIRAQLDLSH